MSLHPGALLGLPPGVPNPVFDAGSLRDLLVLIAAAAGVSLAARRQAFALALALAWAAAALGFWTLAMARPYGVLQDPAITGWAAEVGVAAAGGDGSFLAGEPAAHPRWDAFAARAGARAALLAPTLAPVVLFPAIGLAIAVLGRRPDAVLAAMLWLAAATTEIDAVRGIGLGPFAWARPSLLVALLAGIAAALAAGRLLARARAAAAVAAVIALGVAVLVAGRTRVGAADALAALGLDALPWLPLAVVGCRLRAEGAACGLAIGGACALLLAVPGASDAVAAHALYRTGLVLLSAPAIAAGAAALAGAVRVPLPRERSWSPSASAWAGIVAAAALSGSVLTWWDPPRLDPVAKQSLEPIPGILEDTAGWIRAHTAPTDVFVAGEDYGPAVAVLAGRALLRAPALATAADEERRLRAERAILSGREVDALVRRYGLRYLLVAPGQFRAHGLPEPWPAESAYPLRHDSGRGLRIYDLGVQATTGAADGRRPGNGLSVPRAAVP